MLDKEHIGINIPIGMGEAQTEIRSEVLLIWQSEREAEYKARCYHKIQDKVWGRRATSRGLSRREEVVYSRQRGLNTTQRLIVHSPLPFPKYQVQEDVDSVM